MSPPLAIAAGGTGGHMFPALALAAELERRGRDVVMFTDARGARFAGKRPHRLIRAASPSGALVTRLRGGLSLLWGLGQSLLSLRRLRPGALATFGGYASVPPAVAAGILRLPYLVHEQNAVLGRANRLIARQASRLALAFADTAALPEEQGGIFVAGNPVRPGFGTRAAPPGDDRFRLLVLGGSQGAKVFTDVVPASLLALPERLKSRLSVAQQCRAEDLAHAEAAYRGGGIAVELKTFFDDVPERMGRASLVIARSGASTIAELLALGRPSLLVPYPHAADDHQRANAEVLNRAGAARIFLQSALDANRLTRELAALIETPEALETMARAARGLARSDAAGRLADCLLEVELENMA